MVNQSAGFYCYGALRIIQQDDKRGIKLCNDSKNEAGARLFRVVKPRGDASSAIPDGRDDRGAG